VEFHISVRLDLNEVARRLNATQIAALMHGVAQVLVANPYQDIKPGAGVPALSTIVE
jgi:hypothetical protein